MSGRYQVTKTYTPENGLSATFRQWRATSHCRFIHGYALGNRVTFECAPEDLDENGWVYNFGGLKTYKQFLCDTFDHKTLVALDDPLFDSFVQDKTLGKIQLVEVERTGCEAFAKLCYDWLMTNLDFGGRNVRLISVEVFEHHGNSATYFGEGLNTSNVELRITADTAGIRDAIAQAVEQSQRQRRI